MPPIRSKTMVRPGEQLGFARDLEAAGTWPPSRIRRKHNDVPAATPYLVVLADQKDAGVRPLAGSQICHWAGVEVLDSAGNAVPYPVPGIEYSIRASIRNLGAVACYAGVIEFAVADALVIDAASNGLGVVPVFAIEGFVAAPSATVTVTCRRRWKPADAAEASGSVVIHAYDALLDPVTRRFDAHADRHVGRRDLVPDFSGTWDGLQYLAPGPPGHGYLYRVVIAQTGAAVSVSIFGEVADVADRHPVPVGVPGHNPRPLGPVPVIAVPARPIVGVPGIPAPAPPGPGVVPGPGFVPGLFPQLTGQGTIANGQVQLPIIGLNGTPPAPFTHNDVTLSLPAPDTLRVVTHEEFVVPGDPRGPMDFVADLHHIP